MFWLLHQVTLLVRTADTKNYLINFDQHLLINMKEAEYMAKTGLEVPPETQTLLFAKARMKRI